MTRAILPAALPALAIVAAGWMVADALRPPSPPAAAKAEAFTPYVAPPADPECAERLDASIAAERGNATSWEDMRQREQTINVLCAAERKYGRARHDQP